MTIVIYRKIALALVAIIGSSISSLCLSIEAEQSSDDRGSALAVELSIAFDDLQTNRNATSYRRYFDAYPDSFDDMVELFSDEKYVSLFHPTDFYESWEYAAKYQIEMCKAYMYMDHREYMEKIVKIGIEADSWGGKGNEHLHRAGDIFKSLVWGRSCAAPQTLENIEEKDVLMLSIVKNKSIDDAERFYRAISWYGGEQVVPIVRFLEGICELDEAKCLLLEKHSNDVYTRDIAH